MIITRDYMLKKPPRPTPAKLFLDTQVVPLAVNIAGSLEVALDRAATRTGVRPSVIVAAAAGLLSLGLWRMLDRRGAGRLRHP